MCQKFAGIRSLLVRLIHDESGGQSLEYALLGGAAVAASYSGIASAGQKIAAMWQALDNALAAVAR